MHSVFYSIHQTVSSMWKSISSTFLSLVPIVFSMSLASLLVCQMDVSGIYTSPLARKESKEERAPVIRRTLNPTVTGTSTIGIIFDGGVIVAADTLGSYGSLARFRCLPRVKKLNENCLLAVGGDYADFQNLSEDLDNLIIENDCRYGKQLSAKSIHSWISSVLYYHRSKLNPLLINVLVAGIFEGKPFLGSVNDHGTAYEERVIAHGIGAHLMMPWLRQQLGDATAPTRSLAVDLINRAMTLLFYRDCRSSPRFQYGIIDSDGTCEIHENVCETKWEMMNYEKLPVL